MSEARKTDLYELTMAMSYVREGMTEPATFSLFVRDLPPERGFLVAAGLEPALDYLSGFRIGPEDLDSFGKALGRPARDLVPLLGTAFKGEVRAVPEGTVVFANEPLLEVTAPLPVAQLVETYLLNLVNHQTAVASKAARCVLAAEARPVMDFSMRRTHGLAAGYEAARTGAVVGFAGTSNVDAAASLGLPAIGTMAHSYVEAFSSEEGAFRAFARAHPDHPVTFLVDTYDTDAGVRTAARVLKSHGTAAGSAVRLDSGNLGEQAVRARRILDSAGLTDVLIVASGGLDEYAVDRLVRAGAPIDVYAVGTRMGVSADAPYLDSAYKLVAYGGRPVMKLSSAKTTAPGAKQIFRSHGCSDVIALRSEQPGSGERPLMRPVMRNGRRVSEAPPLREARERFTADLAQLPPEARRITGPTAPRPAFSDRLKALSDQVRHRIESEILAPQRV
ncbi:nicotinate phosphoribosyltransferase [Streptomyces abyssalis]|uniref:Nicotinate phosphoribosyltransferase n=1 Tax=Streptomyces abyssalis TaxID=933944 RepID=A0A1E7JN21_9ACTN|nr:nicotinate phosphoribosyltransferase [Streptomyces abyssalis]OEU86933.1 nicotinate phosphoribosyltransferase [Streptomyces abyssalis]OEU89682.1 nicotinate phosphoribosyltransferase [Streptomyces abyssalis]